MCTLTLVAKDHLPGKIEKEKWYGTEFVAQDIPDNDLNSLHEAEQRPTSQCLSDLYLPNRNHSVPSGFGVYKREILEPASALELIAQLLALVQKRLAITS